MRWHVGTSGWGYDAWQGKFYPDDLPANERIAYYAHYFNDVEINNTFYHLPTRQQLKRWEAQVPPHFTFAVKGSRFITHMKRLKEADETVPNMMNILAVEKKGGPVIFQLPPHFPKNIERLEEFLAVLPRRRRYAIEFRDPDWHDDEVYDCLRRHKVAFCMFEKADARSPRLLTTDFAYVRLHGHKSGYRGNYSKAALRDWKEWLEDQGEDTYVFFDNTDEKLHAVENALTFQQMVQ